MSSNLTPDSLLLEDGPGVPGVRPRLVWPGLKPEATPEVQAWIYQEREAGRSVTAIARDLDRSRPWVYDQLKRASELEAAGVGVEYLLERREAQAEALVAAKVLELSRLDAVQEALDRIMRWSPQRCPGTVPPRNTEIISAARVAIKLCEARAQLLGLNSPVAVALTGEVGVRVSVEQVAAALSHLPEEAWDALQVVNQALDEGDLPP